jgi:hypothetical protein
MQQGGNCHVLGAIVFEHRRRDREQMRDVGNRSALAHLAAVNVRGVKHGSIKTIRQHGGVWHFRFTVSKI